MEGWMVNMCDVLRRDFPQLHSRDRKAYFTLHFILISRTTAWENTLAQHTHTNKHLLNIFQIWANTHTHTHTHTHKHMNL